MLKRAMLSILALFLVVSTARSEVVVLTEKPVAEFTLPDGSVIQNAFVWRRSSAGLMIVHDDGQFFLNFKALPDDWKAAYLGEDETPAAEAPSEVVVETRDTLGIASTLKTIPSLTPAGRAYLLSDDADEETKKDALTLATLQALLKGKNDAVKRFMLIIEESEYEIKSVEKDILFVECGTCGSDGIVKRNCAECGGSGQCPRCGGDGQRDTAIKNRTEHCTTCKGSGDCKVCQGTKGKNLRCGGCGGRGRRLEKNYCEIKRDQLARAANAAANDSEVAAITQNDIELVKKTMLELPNLDEAALEFYFSDAYDGASDTEILAACALHSLLKKRAVAAERFHLMLEIHYPESETLDIDKYLQICETCEGKGLIGKNCGGCRGTGQCDRCDGDGLRETGFKGRTTPCTTCRGSGNCVDCQGGKTKNSRCSMCGGNGRSFDKERSKIKLDLLTEMLNSGARRSR